MKGFNLLLLLLIGILIFVFSHRAYSQTTLPPPSEPPDVILNGQKIIFNKRPILDKDGWLFPLEEIAEKLQDKISVDIVSGQLQFKDYVTKQQFN